MLARELIALATPDGELMVKRVARPGGARTAKAEIEQLRAAPGGHAARAKTAQRAEAHALEGAG